MKVNKKQPLNIGERNKLIPERINANNSENKSKFLLNTLKSNIYFFNHLLLKKKI